MPKRDGAGQRAAEDAFECGIPTAFRLAPPGREHDLDAFPALAPLPDWPDPVRPRPRLILTPDRLEALRRDVEQGFLKGLWPKLWQYHVQHHPEQPGAIRSLDRTHAYVLMWRALRYAVLRDPTMLDETAAWLRAIVESPLLDHRDSLVTGEILLALGLTLDWLGADLPPDLAGRVRQRMAVEAAQIVRAAEAGAVWWATCWLQNHFTTNEAGIGIAAMALADAPEEPLRRIALDLYRHALTRMRKSIYFQPPDGSVPELCRYAFFMTENQLLFFEALRTFSGEDLYGAFARRRIDYIIHQLIPAPFCDGDLLNWGDNGRSSWPHPPAGLLYALARRFRDPLAQGAADWLVARSVGLDRNKNWLIPLHRDPSVPPADFPPEDRGILPASYHAEDQGLVTMRSAWTPNATMLGLLCGPFQGHRLRRLVNTDLGAAHRHPDNGSFQICVGRTYLVTDPGYELLKSTANHNTVLVDGRGQVGEGNTWLNVNNCLNREGEALRIEAFEDAGGFVHVVAQAAGAYDPDLQLTSFTRRLIFVRPDLIVVHDRLDSAVPREYRLLLHGDPEHRFTELGPAAWRVDAGEAGLDILALQPAGTGLGHEIRSHQITRSRFVAETRRLDLYNAHAAKSVEFLVVMHVLRGPDVQEALGLEAAVEQNEHEIRLAVRNVQLIWPTDGTGRPTLPTRATAPP